jgi:outer membrane protein assembly factor BamB
MEGGGVRRLLLLMIGLALSGEARAEDWPQFLGPRRDGTSREIVKPWSGELKILWRAPVGEGHSSPVVAGGHVFLHDKVAGKDAERLTVFDAESGKPLAATDYPRGTFTSPFGNGPRATPVVAGNRIYSFGVTGRLAATDVTRDGDAITLRPLFAVDPLMDFKAPNLKFGVSATPLVEGGLLVVPVGGKGAGVVAYDRNNGKVVWHVLDDPASYSSPVAIGEGASRQIIVLTQKGLVSLAPKDGATLWQFPFQDALSESSTTPVQAGGLLIASSVTLGSAALKLSVRDGKPSFEQVWKKPELSCYFSTPVPVGSEHLYMVNGVLALNPSVMLRCVETATGKTLWSRPKIGKYHAALVRTGDDKLLMLDDAGRLTLLEPNAREYRQLAQSKVCGETWAHPALANGRIYLRDARELICLEMPK